MLDQLVKTLVSLGSREAALAEPKVVKDLVTDRRKTHVIVDGKLTTYDISPPLRRHEVSTLGDLMTAITRWGGDGTVVYVGESLVVMHLDDNDRRDAVYLPLVRTPLFETLENLLGKNFAQATLIRLLRRELTDLNERDVLLSAIRNIRWQTSEGGQANADHGRESLGVSIERQVAGIAQNFPELATVTAGAYIGVPQQYPFELTIEINIQARLFSIEPLPGQIAECKLLARELIQTELRSKFPASGSGKSGLTVVLGGPTYSGCKEDDEDDG